MIFFIFSTLRKGKHKLHVWPDCEADGNHDTTTPSKLKDHQENDMDKLEKVTTYFEIGHSPQNIIICVV